MLLLKLACFFIILANLRSAVAENSGDFAPVHKIFPKKQIKMI